MGKRVIAGAAGAGVLLLSLGYGIGSSAGHTVTVTKDVAVTKNVPGPVRTVTKTVTKDVPGPTVYKTKYVPASQGPAGTTIASYSGSGNENTGSFQVPSSGDYIVKWSYSNNNDCSLGSCQAANFSISDTNVNGGFQGNEPNDIAASGSGSTEDTNMSGAQSFNVEATGNWAITVIGAS